MEKILLTYEKDESDIPAFAENYYKYSYREKKLRIFAMIVMYIVIAVLSYPVHKRIEEGLITYLALVLVVSIIMTYFGWKGFEKDRIGKIKRELSTQNMSVLGEYRAELSEEEIHVIYRPNNPNRERNMTNNWEEISYYTRENEHFFIFMENPSFVYHIIAGDKANDVNYFLSQKLNNKTKRE
ncbi:hypothetical protein [Oceanobacillus sp. 1P07AA]|uniref:hypothetical protein n=1 Tax=Oceanobacillus sp. 1P07AA TaxID=3132293 RepID=UPI0039A70831